VVAFDVVELTNKVALITAANASASWSQASWPRAAPTWCSAYARSRDEAEQAARGVRASAGAPRWCRQTSRSLPVARRWSARRPRKWAVSTLLLNMASVYAGVLRRSDGSGLGGTLNVDLREASLRARGCPAHAAAGRRSHHHFSDWTARSGRPRYQSYLPYYVAKAGIIALTEALALELASQHPVNAIAPGPILPPPTMSDAELGTVEKATRSGRWAANSRSPRPSSRA